MNILIDKSTKPKNKIISALDIGSTKICCLIARIDTFNTLQGIGFSHQKSQGVQKGRIVDLEAAQDVIGEVIEQAEKLAGITLKDIYVNLNNPETKSLILESEVTVASSNVERSDIEAVLEQGWSRRPHTDSYPLHTFPLFYTLDDTQNVPKPYGMQAQKLYSKLHFLTSNKASINNLVSCLQANHLPIKKIIASSYASGLSTISPQNFEETEKCIICLDIGGDTTKAAIFHHNMLLYSVIINQGGRTLTLKIAQKLRLTFSEAEHFKIVHGNAIESSQIEQEIDSHTIFSRQQLVQIIRTEFKEIFESMLSSFQEIGLRKEDEPILILTGGSSQLSGIRELAQEIFNPLMKEVHLSFPKMISQETSSPEFATLVGLLLYPTSNLNEIYSLDETLYPTLGKKFTKFWNKVTNIFSTSNDREKDSK